MRPCKPLPSSTESGEESSLSFSDGRDGASWLISFGSTFFRRAISEVSDRCVNRIGTVGSMMGEACGVERWASELFAEEVVRGGPAFAISLLLSTIDPFLRNVAALGSWQV
jgi:hypothetical protein